MDSPARPYRDTSNQEIVLLTDRQLDDLPAGHPYRRIEPGEPLTPVVNPEVEIDAADTIRWGDDGGNQIPPPIASHVPPAETSPNVAFEGGAPDRRPPKGPNSSS